MIKGPQIAIRLSNVNGATVASVVMDAKGGIYEDMLIGIQELYDSETKETKGTCIAVKSDSGSGVSGTLSISSVVQQPPKKRPREDMITGREFLERIEKKVDDAVAKVGIDALQAYYTTDEFKCKVQEAVAEKVKELEPEIRKRLQ